MQEESIDLQINTGIAIHHDTIQDHAPLPIIAFFKIRLFIWKEKKKSETVNQIKNALVTRGFIWENFLMLS